MNQEPKTESPLSPPKKLSLQPMSADMTDPEKVKENIRKKFQDEKLPLVDEVVELDQKFREAKEIYRKLIEEDNEKQRVGDRNYLFDHADEEFVRKMEKIRLGKNPEE